MQSNTGRPALRGGVFVLALLVAMVPGLLSAQSGSARLSGTVRDGSGKAIAGATVTAESVATSQTAKTETGTEGGYMLAGLAPVKSFNTGDANRDLHMLEATRGAEFPLVVVRAHFRETELNSATIHVDLDV